MFQIKNACCITGHREFDINNSKKKDRIDALLKDILYKLVMSGYNVFLYGGAEGFDGFCADYIVRLREKFKDDVNIFLVAVLPYSTPARIEEEKKRYNPDKIYSASKDFYKDCYFKRNQVMVNNSSACICYFNESKSGTGNTVRYAEDRGHDIYNIFELKDLPPPPPIKPIDEVFDLLFQDPELHDFLLEIKELEARRLAERDF